MTTRRKKKTLLATIFRAVAPRIDATVTLDPEWNIAGQISYPSGRKRYFRFSSIDVNTLGASEIAKDKDFANHFMRKMGYPTIPGRTFFSNEWAKTIGSDRTIGAALTYAEKLGFPVVAKPNSASQGRGVALVRTKRELRAALRAIFGQDRVALVQKRVVGKDYRVVVLGDRVISAYERIPLNVIGDGKSTVRQLLVRKQKEFARARRDTIIHADDPRISIKLEGQGLSLNSVAPKGNRVYLLDNANLSSGGESIDVTQTMHPRFREVATRLTKDMGLHLCGVDLMIAGDIAEKDSSYWIIEINSAPGLDHYATSGARQRQIVEDMYLEVLKYMDK